MTSRLAPWLLTLALLPLLPACKKAATETAHPGDHHSHAEGDHAHAKGEKDHHAGDLEGRELVDNWAAQVGDVTVCPVSGKKFEVAESSPRYEYQGRSFVFCCPMCLDKTKAEATQYLDPLVEAAGGPITAE
jgi:YHS domain-containing protein